MKVVLPLPAMPMHTIDTGESVGVVEEEEPEGAGGTVEVDIVVVCACG